MLGIVPNLFLGHKVVVMPSLTVVLMLGIGIGVIGSICAIVVLFFMLSHPNPKYVQFESQKRRFVTSTGSSDGNEGGKDISNQGPTMPHALAEKGRYRGVVFTVPMSKWKRKDCIIDWPPLMDPLIPWFAEIDDGTLVLHPIHPAGRNTEAVESSQSSEASLSTLKKTISEKKISMPTEKLGIPLEGCIVEIVRDGLLGRSDMIRRAPILLCHPEWLLMEGEHGFYMFADDPASKMQWVTALRWWGSHDNVSKNVHDMYSDYCGDLSYRNPITPYLSQRSSDVPIETIPSEPVVMSRSRSTRWRRWRKSSAKMKNNQPDDNVSDLGNLIEEQWMHKGILRRSRRNDPEKNDLGDAEIPGCSNDDVQQSDNVHGEHSLPRTPQMSPCKNDPNKNYNISNVQDLDEKAFKERAAVYSLPNGWPKELPTLLPFDYFLNDFLARGCFDLVRNPNFISVVKSKIQAQLGRMHSPDYVQSLEVIEVVAGSTSPSVANLSALPSPTNSHIMPQLVFDMQYEGDFTVTIECKVDIRDARGWGTLDKAFDLLEGKRRPQKPNLFKNDQVNPKATSKEFILPESQEEVELLREACGIHDTDKNSDEGVEEMQPQNSSIMTLDSLRHSAAQTLRRIADSTALHISKIPLRVSLTFSLIEGQMCAWIPPPPGDRLFWAFLTPPNLKIKARPQVSGRFVKYAYHASRASQWIEARMKLAFTKNLVFPSGGDFPMPLLLSIDSPDADNPPHQEEPLPEDRDTAPSPSCPSSSSSPAHTLPEDDDSEKGNAPHVGDHSTSGQAAIEVEQIHGNVQPSEKSANHQNHAIKSKADTSGATWIAPETSSMGREKDAILHRKSPFLQFRLRRDSNKKDS